MNEKAPKFRPRLIIHGGAGNIQKETFTPEKYAAYRTSLLSILSNTASVHMRGCSSSALDIATHAVVQLENNPLFNSGHGAVFTRDGVNELEASVMVSRGRAKRAVGVMGLRHVRNPILLAKKILEHGDEDLAPPRKGYGSSPNDSRMVISEGDLDVPSAQGHTQIFGQAAEQLAKRFGLEIVEQEYFFTQQRWDEHQRGLDRELQGSEGRATWSADEFLPQGTCGAVAMDEDGIICAATSTGGLTNKLTGRVGDTPVPGAGFWAEEWEDEEPPKVSFWDHIESPGSILMSLSNPLKRLVADCLPTPSMYTPLYPMASPRATATRSVGISGTGNGDSFLRIDAVRTVAARARFKSEPASVALASVSGPGGELQRSAGDRWGRTGEGEGGMIGIEAVVVRDGCGSVVHAKSEILMDFNSAGMYRAWINDHGEPMMSIWTNGGPDDIQS